MLDHQKNQPAQYHQTRALRPATVLNRQCPVARPVPEAVVEAEVVAEVVAVFSVAKVVESAGEVNIHQAGGATPLLFKAVTHQLAPEEDVQEGGTHLQEGVSRQPAL